MIKIKKEFEAGHGYTKEDWDAVDSPPATKEQLAQAKPFAEAFPELAEKMRKNLGGRPVAENPKQAISIRLSPDVLSKLKSSGKGWQSRVDDILRKAVGL